MEGVSGVRRAEAMGPISSAFTLGSPQVLGMPSVLVLSHLTEKDSCLRSTFNSKQPLVLLPF